MDCCNPGADRLCPRKLLISDLSASQRGLGVKLDGVVGVNLLQRGWLSIRYSSAAVSFGERPTLTGAAVIKLIHKVKQYLVPITVSGHSLQLLLDTGTNFSV